MAARSGSAAPTTPIEVVADPVIEAAKEPEVADAAAEEAPAAEVAAEEPTPEPEATKAKGKSRAANIPDADRYGESLVRDLLGGIPLDDQPGAGR